MKKKVVIVNHHEASFKDARLKKIKDVDIDWSKWVAESTQFHFFEIIHHQIFARTRLSMYHMSIRSWSNVKKKAIDNVKKSKQAEIEQDVVQFLIVKFNKQHKTMIKFEAIKRAKHQINIDVKRKIEMTRRVVVEH